MIFILQLSKYVMFQFKKGSVLHPANPTKISFLMSCSSRAQKGLMAKAIQFTC